MDEEPELRSQEDFDDLMFGGEPNHGSDHDQVDPSMAVAADVSDESDGGESDAEFSGQSKRAMPAATQTSRRSSRHQCTEVDAESGQPCGNDFSRAGYVVPSMCFEALLTSAQSS